ncbi:tyrosine-type recombinase/integrase [Thiorhodococcus mannitoliphagus]|uniref:Tyrosine-type recombinase/integrase n=1 Tax=Thiorhodococcus mannitoliphagus TaxID=329406 RepID=A0A6P1E3M6_9GAMM|nr:tyrosine-type recombinase/integrase [Thiorhodococcus mannitoliphagus]NEX23693.1 tyrosine-type recombinase/integrase [Thiorhodococcus mannitoliphagus]
MTMTIPLQKYVTEFLDERHRLGFQSRSMGHALRGLSAYIETLALTGPLTLEVMAQWARQPSHRSEDPKTWARRLKILRPFTRWLRQFEPDTEVPDEAIFGSVGERLTPHIYREQEIIALLAAARQLQPPRRGATYETLFGLLAATGLRLSEAVHLCLGDVDLRDGVLTVRETKFHKSRQVPVHPTTLAALRRYHAQCDREIIVTEESPFFVGSRDRRHAHRPSPRQVDRIFQQLREQLGWVNRGAHAAPRLHDLRHTFVVRRILLWQAQGVDIDQRMLALSTYVGHAHVTDTYWYLSAVPELMAVAAECFEAGQYAAEVACD